MNVDFSFLGESVNESSAMPKELFTNPAIFELEKEKIFRDDWIAVARVDQLANPGDYLVYDFFGDSIIVAKDKGGNINAFSNVCIHRGCPIATGSGNKKNLFTCPYHKWTYELNGQLRGAPAMHTAVGFDRSDQRLPQLAVEIWQGWVFVNASKDPEPLAPQLTPLESRLKDWNVADMKIVFTMEFESPWNWKIMVENFMESYHHMGAHPDTLNSLFPYSGTFEEESNEHFSLLENPSIDEAAPPFWVGIVFPDLLFALVRNPDAPSVTWFRMEIDSHDRFLLKIHNLMPEELAANEEVVEMSRATLQAIHLEDISMCEGVWKGVQSTLYEPGRLSELEACNWYFHRYLKSKLA